MKVTSSSADGFSQILTITYTDMPPTSLSGKEISITCQGFYNPIYQKLWGPFIVSIFDSNPL